jgi:hypothetical protein
MSNKDPNKLLLRTDVLSVVVFGSRTLGLINLVVEFFFEIKYLMLDLRTLIERNVSISYKSLSKEFR